MEKCQAFTKEMATFKMQDQEADTTDSEDNNTTEKLAMDELEGGNSAQAMLILDALKQNFAMLQAQDLSAKFNEIHDSRAMKATGNDAKSKGKSRTVKGETTAVMICLLKHVFRGLAEEHHTTEPKYSSVFLFLQGIIYVLDEHPAFQSFLSNHCSTSVPATTAGFAASKPLQQQTLFTLTSKGQPHSSTSVTPPHPLFTQEMSPRQPLHPPFFHPSLMLESFCVPSLYTAPRQMGHFANNEWRVLSWGPMSEVDQEMNFIHLSDFQRMDISDLFKDLVGQEPGLWSDIPDTCDPLNLVSNLVSSLNQTSTELGSFSKYPCPTVKPWELAFSHSNQTMSLLRASLLPPKIGETWRWEDWPVSGEPI